MTDLGIPTIGIRTRRKGTRTQLFASSGTVLRHSTCRWRLLPLLRLYRYLYHALHAFTQEVGIPPPPQLRTDSGLNFMSIRLRGHVVMHPHFECSHQFLSLSFSKHQERNGTSFRKGTQLRT